MVNNGITGVPVVDEDMALVGILSEQNVLRLFHTHQQERDRTAGEFMTQPAVYFEENEVSAVQDLINVIDQKA